MTILLRKTTAAGKYLVRIQSLPTRFSMLVVKLTFSFDLSKYLKNSFDEYILTVSLKWKARQQHKDNLSHQTLFTEPKLFFKKETV